MDEPRGEPAVLAILHLEDSREDAELIRARLETLEEAVRVDWAPDEPRFSELLARGGHDIVLADFSLPAFDGLAALRMAREFAPGVPFICVSGAIGEENVVELLMRGATDFVSKHHLDRLPPAIRRALKEKRERDERLRAEEENARLESQLRHAQKMELVGRLAGGVAHDFNNMLQVILGNVELAMTAVEPVGYLAEKLEEIRTCAERSADLTRQLLAFARKQTVLPKTLDLNETLSGMRKMLARLIGEDIRLEWRPGASACPVRMDPSQLDQVMVNLCVNARDAIAGVGTIVVETGSVTVSERPTGARAGTGPGEYARLTVRDDGSGMDRDTLAHLFEPFFTTKGVGKGTGLGLATVYGIVQQNGGSIEVDSVPGEGSCFTILLPRAEPGADGGAARPALAEPDAAGRETVLLVEDEGAILGMVASVLRSRGYRVLAAMKPEDAVRAAREHEGVIHLMLSDVVMPGMNGGELSRAVRALHPAIRTLFMSGYTSDETVTRQGGACEGGGFLQKPFTMKELLAGVRAALDAPAPAPSSPPPGG